MAPPKLEEPCKVAIKTQSNTKSLQETTREEQAHRHVEGVVDVDAIPSPQDEPVNATIVEEEGQAPMVMRMEIDPQISVG
jgi:hypothetical protein